MTNTCRILMAVQVSPLSLCLWSVEELDLNILTLVLVLSAHLLHTDFNIVKAYWAYLLITLIGVWTPYCFLSLSLCFGSFSLDWSLYSWFFVFARLIKRYALFVVVSRLLTSCWQSWRWWTDCTCHQQSHGPLGNSILSIMCFGGYYILSYKTK